MIGGSSRHAAVRQRIIDTAQRMNELGLNRGTSGNISVRSGEGLLITPSGVPYESMQTSDLVRMDWSGRTQNEGNPSSEWRMHRDLLHGREDKNVILHAHPVACTALACLGREIPAFHYMVAVAGGKKIPCAPYATFGSKELSDHVASTMGSLNACLLANHGLVVVADDLEAALFLAVEIETLAAIYCKALPIGEPALLTDAQMDEVLEKFKTYGTGFREFESL